MNRKHTYRILFSMCLCLCSFVMRAQQVNLAKATNALYASKLDSAKYYIDLASADADTKSNATCWFLKAIIYKNLYKQKEDKNVASPLRDQAYQFHLKSLALDSTADNKKKNFESLKFIASKYYNDAVITMNKDDYAISVDNFETYKDIMLKVDPKFDARAKDIEYNLALASMYKETFDLNPSDNSFEDLAKVTYIKVIDMDPENLSANFNLGVIFYNSAVNKINALPLDIDIETLFKAEDNADKLFKQALPLLDLVWNKDPKYKTCEVLRGLETIYYGLNDKDNYVKYKLHYERTCQ